MRADLHGTFTFDRTWNAIQAVKCEVKAHPVDGVLIDLRGVDYTPSLDEVAHVANELVGFLGRRRLAFVARSVVQFGMASLIVLQADALGTDISVFLDETDAMTWLRSPISGTRVHGRYPRLWPTPKKLD
ncbi:MAG: hypothetical protein HOQ29_18745 [Acidobacteria bacterium]|nr:hypothetical protein [Acidobacteriota bacterium]